MLSLSVSVLQQPVLLLENLPLYVHVSVIQQPVLCQEVTACSSLQEHVLHLYVCFVEQPVMYQEVSDLLQFVLYPDVSVYTSLCLCWIWKCLSLYKCFCAALGGVCLQ